MVLLLHSNLADIVDKVHKVDIVDLVAKIPNENDEDPLETKSTNSTNSNEIDDVQSKPTDEPFSEEYLDSVLTCRRMKKAISSGITDPIKLAEACGLPVCLIVKETSRWPGVNSITAADVLSQLEKHRHELHYKEQADRLIRARQKDPFLLRDGCLGSTR